MSATTWFDFPDSEVRLAEMDQGTLRLVFSAARAEHEGVAGYLNGLALRFDEAICLGDLPACIGAIAEGAIQVDGQGLRHLPVPFAARTRVTAELRFKSGALLSVRAAGVSCPAPDPFRFAESFAC